MSKSAEDTVSIRIYRGMSGETLRGLWVEMLPDGGLRLIGQDISESLKAQYGDADYEYWVDVSASDLARLRGALVAALPTQVGHELRSVSVLSLVERVYANDVEAFQRFRALCAAASVPAKFGCWH
jgi:hypothetical protein